MIVERQITASAVAGIQAALNTDTAVDYFHANSQQLVDWVRQQKNSSSGVDMHSFGMLLKLLQHLLQLERLQPPCANLLVLLNNMFCLDGSAVEQLLFNKPALETLRSLVVEFCQRYVFLECTDQLKENDCNIPKANFELYSTIYFVAMLICQNNRRGEDTTLRKHFFTHTLVRSLMELQIPPTSKPDIFKLISIIMVFMVKRVIYANQWSLIKKSCFAHLHLIKDSKTVFNYMYCLRSLLLHEPVSTHELIKYKVLDFVSNSLSYPVHQYHVGCALESLKLIYSKNHYAKTRHAEMEVARHIIEQFQHHTPVVVGLVEELWEHTPLDQVFLLYNHFYKMFLEATDYRRQALKICSVLMQRFSLNCLVDILEQGILEQLEQLLKTQANIRSVQTTLRIVELLLERAKKEAPAFHNCLTSKLWSMELLQLAASWGFHLKDLALNIQKRHSVF